MFNIEYNSIEFTVIESTECFGQSAPYMDWQDPHAENPLFRCSLNEKRIENFKDLAGTVYHEMAHIAEAVNNKDFGVTHDGAYFNHIIDIGGQCFPELMPFVTEHDFKADKKYYINRRRNFSMILAVFNINILTSLEIKHNISKNQLFSNSCAKCTENVRSHCDLSI